jgi:hypothetical protein
MNKSAGVLIGKTDARMKGAGLMGIKISKSHLNTAERLA